jgi:AraC-like DNA-binding protein
MLLAAGFWLGLPGRAAVGPEQGKDRLLSFRQLRENLAAKKYTGRRIDLVFSNTGLQAVMAELEKAGGFRLEMDPSIDDRVTYRMLNVPWDEALAAVVSDNALHLLPNLEGTGFKISRDVPIVLAFPKKSRAKLVMFLYEYLYYIIVGIVLLAAAVVILPLLRRRRARQGRLNGKKPLLSSEAAEHVKAGLKRAMQDERLYRDEGLSLQSLAERLAVSPHQLSWILNEELRVSFSSLVNGFRVEEVKARLADRSIEAISILQMALEAGFNSKAAFNRAFKIHTGTTPSEYKKSLPR